MAKRMCFRAPALKHSMMERLTLMSYCFPLLLELSGAAVRASSLASPLPRLAAFALRLFLISCTVWLPLSSALGEEPFQIGSLQSWREGQTRGFCHVGITMEEHFTD